MSSSTPMQKKPLMQPLVFLGLLSIGLNAYAQEPSAQGLSGYVEKKANAVLGQRLMVETGEVMLAEGSIMEGKSIEITQSKQFLMSGPLFIPFKVSIEKGKLHLKNISVDWHYFCADQGLASASLPMLGNLLSEGDCVGIRVSINEARKEWVVDNSHYNRTETIWSKAMTAEESAEYMLKTETNPFKIRSLRTISFDGFYGGQLHFTHAELNGQLKDARTFTFDFNREPVTIGIKGHIFKVLEANAMNASYEWLKLKDQ